MLRPVAGLLLCASMVALAGCAAIGARESLDAVGAQAPRAAALPPQPIPAVVRIRMSAAETCHIPDLREEILRRLNALRASGARCGSRRLPAAPPVAWNDVLFSAAARHSLDMAAHNAFDHQGSRGLGPNERVSREGYPWRSMAENIAGGDGSVASVMRGWERSPEHCRAMLDPSFTEVGVACVERPQTDWGTYWTMELARPR